MKLTPQRLVDFKHHCTENDQISSIILREAQAWIEGPVADVGAGHGDIALQALSSFDCVLIDILDYSSYPLAERHRRLREDVFSVSAGALGCPRTLLLSHVLQYLDDDLNALGALFDRIDAAKLLVVSNRNSGVMERLVDWSTKTIPDANPEVDTPGVFNRYNLSAEWQFEAELRAGSRDELALGVLHLLDVSVDPTSTLLVEQFLLAEGLERTLTIDQVIRAYERRQ